MWLFNSGRPWELPANVFYVKDAKLENVELQRSATSSAPFRTASRR